MPNDAAHEKALYGAARPPPGNARRSRS